LKGNKVKKKKKYDPKKKLFKSSKERAEDIIRLIRARESRKLDVYKVPIWEEQRGIWRHGKTHPITNRPMTADTWQRFKRDFIEEYGGEQVKETGLTDSEFWEWFKSGRRELHKEPSKMAALLAELNAHQDASENSGS